MNCPRCRADNDDGARFCEDCGARLEKACASCGTPVTLGKKFCRSCGVAVGTEPASRFTSPAPYTPKHLAEKILTSRAALEGERKQVTVLFADLKSSMELIADRDPEEARSIFDPVIEQMMEAVHRYEGTVNQVLGDGIMALFGAPLAHEDHAVRACYAALRMQESVKKYAEGAFRNYGIPVRIRVGLNSGEVVVRSIGSDLHMDYTAVGQTTHLAARMEQIADPATIRLTADTLHLAEGFIQVQALGPTPVKGLPTPVEVYELTGASPVRSRLQATASRGLTKFVGREGEMGTLFAALKQARAGRGQVVAIVGDPGVGKSRLVWEFTHSHRTARCLVLEAPSVSYGRSTTYLPVIELLKRYVGIEPRDDGRRIREKATGKLFSLDRALEPTLAPLLWLLDAPVDDADWERLDPVLRRQRLHEAVRQLLLRESREQPLVVVFEDLHWIDGETQAVLDELVESLPTARVCLLVNYRPEYRHEWGRKTYYTQVRLDALHATRAAELLGALLGTHPSLKSLVSMLIARTDGNPFFLEEMVQTLVEAGALVGERGAYRLVHTPEALEIPATARAILSARIDRLAPDDKRLLQTAAVIGKDVPHPLLAAIADVDEPTLRAALVRLQETEFLYEVQLFPELEYTFKHALTHEVAYGSLLQDRRKVLHARLVDEIERVHASRLDEQTERLAHHAYAAGRWDQAGPYYRRAASRALARSAYRESAAFCRKALDALSRQPSDQKIVTEAIDVRLELRTALLALGENDHIRDLLHEAEQLAASAGDASRLAWIQGFRCMSHWGLGELERAHEAGEQALATGQRLGDERLQSQARLGLGWTFHARGEYRQSVAELSAIVADANGAPEISATHDTTIDSIMASSWIAACHTELGEFDAALVAGRRAHSLATKLGQPWGLAAAHYAVGMLYLRQEKLVDASAELQAGLRFCRQYEIWNWFTGLGSALGLVWALTGQPEPGCRLLREAVDRAEAMKSVFRQSLRVAWLAEAEWLAGRLESARALAQDALVLADKHEEHGHRVHVLRLLGDLALEAGDSRAEGYFQSTIDKARELAMRPVEAYGHLGLGRLSLSRSDLDGAREALRHALALFESMNVVRAAARARAALEDMSR